jgi:hypothetical protein
MTIRSLDFLDLPTLSHYRRDVLPLDNARLLTRGNPLGAMAMLSYLNPRRHIYTAVASQDGDSLMGQVTLEEGETSARLTFLAPAKDLNGLTTPLLDHLTLQATEWGAFHLLAEVDENAPSFRCLREAGFAMYAWQRAWKLPPLDDIDEEMAWRQVDDIDWPAVQSLHDQIVPALIQPVDALSRLADGMVCRPEGNLQAYVRVVTGSRGIWLMPLIPPDAGCTSERLAGLSRLIRGWGTRPVYVCVRSYQAWLEAALEDLGAEGFTRQAVLVRRMAKTVKAELSVKAMEKVLVKPAAPVARIVPADEIPTKSDIKSI